MNVRPLPNHDLLSLDVRDVSHIEAEAAHDIRELMEWTRTAGDQTATGINYATRDATTMLAVRRQRLLETYARWMRMVGARGAGMTSMQMLAARQGAVLIVPGSFTLVQFQRLAQACQRYDLRIMGETMFIRDSHGMSGDSVPQIVLDHAGSIAPDTTQALHEVARRIGKRWPPILMGSNTPGEVQRLLGIVR